MAKQPQNSAKPVDNKKETGVNYAYKPRLIGVVIKNLIMEMKLNERDVADYMGISQRSLWRWYEREYLFREEIMKLSKLLQVNLLALYHPDVKPGPDETSALRKENTKLRTELTELEDKRDLLVNETIRLRAQNNLLQKQVKEFIDRK